MDNSNCAVTSDVRYDHIQRLLKHYELTALNNLGGPAAAMSSAAAMGQTSAKPSNFAVSSALSNFILRRENMNDKRDMSTIPDRSINLNEILSLRQAIPVQPFPVLTPSDRMSAAAAENQETILEGEYIACFTVGGEKRLCLPQVYSTVLKNYSVIDINRARTELSIYCNQCTVEQLQAFKTARVLASTATSCGLITKTDAERLCNYLLRQKKLGEKTGALSSMTTAEQKREKRRHASSHRSPNVNESEQSSPRVTSTSTGDAEDLAVPVMHLCFGRCRGRYHARMYASPSAECIECDECGDFFAPDRFVTHSHRNQERRTCHWGFDSANWRSYIHLPAGAETKAENGKSLEQMKLRFDVSGLTKRKFDEHVNPEECNNKQMRKRMKLDAGDQPVPNAVCSEKLSSTVPTSAVLGDFEQQKQSGLPYFLCDPLVLVTYYQTLLSNATNTNSTLPACQGATTSAGLGGPTPLSLPLVPTNGFCGIDVANSVDGSVATGAKAGLVTLHRDQSQLLQASTAISRSTGAVVDEATAVAALKLLQLGGRNDTANECSANVVVSPPALPGSADKAAMVTTSTDAKNVSADVDGRLEKNNTQHHIWSPSSKESFKKQLLHLFIEEQQHKRELERKCEARQPEPGRASVEVIVDDGCDVVDKEKSRPLEVTESDLQKCDAVNGRESEDTQVADESSATSSDIEGALNGETSLDDLLKRYITDAEGLHVVRSKIAASQRYIEQKSDAVAAENRLLRAECFHLKSQQYGYQLKQEQERLKQRGVTLGLDFLHLLPESLKS